MTRPNLLTATVMCLFGALISQACVEARGPAESEAAGGHGAGVTSTATAGGGSGGANGSGGAATGGSGGAPPACDDLDSEPNGSEGMAEDLGNITDCDGDRMQVVGTIAGLSDEDWFTFFGDDTTLCTVDPRLTLDSGDSRIEHCVYIDCLANGTATLQCPMDATSDTSANGHPGCCSSSGTLQFASFECPTSDDSADVYVRMRAPDAGTACLDYTFTIQY